MIAANKPDKIELVLAARNDAHAAMQSFRRDVGGVTDDIRRLERQANQMQRQQMTMGQQMQGFNQKMKLLRGGGAAIGVAFSVRLGSEAAEAASQIANSIRAGEMEWRKTIADSVRGLPLFGDAFKLGENLHEMMTGTKFYAESIAKSLKTMNDAASDHRKIVEQVHQQYMNWEGTATGLVRQMALMGTTGPKREEQTAEHGLADRRRQFTMEINKQLHSLEDKYGDIFKSLRDEETRLGKQIAAQAKRASGESSYGSMQLGPENRKWRELKAQQKNVQNQIVANEKAMAEEVQRLRRGYHGTMLKSEELYQAQLADIQKRAADERLKQEWEQTEAVRQKQADVGEQASEAVQEERLRHERTMLQIQGEAAELDLRKLDINADIESRKARLLELAKDENLAAEQRLAIERALADLEAERQARIERAEGDMIDAAIERDKRRRDRAADFTPSRGPLSMAEVKSPRWTSGDSGGDPLMTPTQQIAQDGKKRTSMTERIDRNIAAMAEAVRGGQAMFLRVMEG